MELLDFLEQNDGKPALMTWDEVGEKWNISGNAARKRWDRYNRESAVEKQQIVATSNDPNTHLEGMRKVKTWQNAKGEWLSSYERLPEGEDGDFVESLTDSFEAILLKNSKGVNTVTPSAKNGENTLVVVVSDIHVGSKIDDNVMFEISYDGDVFRGRMEQVFDFIMRRRELNGAPFKKFVMFDLGDSLDGHEGRTTRGTVIPQNMNTAEMWETYVDVMVELWRKIVSNDVAEEYGFTGASNANHSGMLDYIAMQGVGKIIETLYGVDVYISRKFIDLKLIESNGVKYHYVFTHGKDEKDRKYGLTLTLDAKTREYVQGVIDAWGVPNTKNTIVIKGDLHQSAYTRSHNRWHYVSCPSVFGSSGHAVNNYTATEPGFYFEILDGEDRITGVKDFN